MDKPTPPVSFGSHSIDGVCFCIDCEERHCGPTLTCDSQCQAHEATFAEVSCSQCGETFGPGEHGFSACDEHGIGMGEFSPEPECRAPRMVVELGAYGPKVVLR
jgi:hypothetical protein